ncbi:Arc-like DNA binding domain-containing protein [Friedmanniella luteola]|uniref:Arc-like DNA binding domain-containing protein n=1 Tax=Friedmanniella luteola TaxID=546871 RepID=A0A1H1SRK8_9ACTN|nr:Arc family DNA-binding protein [Friedmanniella luteola]SDS50561.1 Arc-like DNA binding domain-containing protein [Friedmanniella luteola]
MELTPYVASVRRGVQDSAALADDHTRQVAERLGAGVEAATRLALLSALADAASEISVELAPGSVDLRMQGAEPTFVVTLPTPAPHDVTVLQPEDPTVVDPLAADADADEQQARVSLRLPQSVKEKVDEYADAEGVSTNTWLLHRVLEALADRTRAGRGRGQGWGLNIGHDGVRLNVPPSVPVPPPPFRPGFPLAEHDPRPGRGRPEGDRSDRGRRGDGPRDGGSGTVQGWVR